MTESVKSSSSFPAPAANSQKQNEKKARPTLEERLQELLRSPTLVRGDFLVGGTRVGVLFNPQGSKAHNLPASSSPVTINTTVITANAMSSALEARVLSILNASGLPYMITHSGDGTTFRTMSGHVTDPFTAYGFNTH